jgi:hypothetical protein
LKGQRSHKAEGAVRRKSGWLHIYWGLHNIEKQEEFSDIEKTAGSGGSKSQTPIERERMAIERIEGTAEDLRMAHKKGQN